MYQWNKFAAADYICVVNQDAIPKKIEWSKYFDGIYCIHYLPNKERKKFIERQLDLVGIKDSPIFEYMYTYPNLFDKVVGDTIGMAHEGMYQSPHEGRRWLEQNLSAAFYRIMQLALNKGQHRILTLEDDVIFHQPINTLYDYLEHLPPDWDYIHFDNVLSIRETNRLGTMRWYNGYYHSGYTGGYWGTGMVGWGTKAMQVGVRVLEKSIWPADYIIENRDNAGELQSLKRYAAATSIVYQHGQELRYHFPT